MRNSYSSSNIDSRLNAFAQTFKYRSPLWIESDSEGSKSGSVIGSGLGNSDDSLRQSSNSSDSSNSINNFLDSKVGNKLMELCISFKLKLSEIGNKINYSLVAYLFVCHFKAKATPIWLIFNRRDVREEEVRQKEEDLNSIVFFYIRTSKLCHLLTNLLFLKGYTSRIIP